MGKLLEIIRNTFVKYFSYRYFRQESNQLTKKKKRRNKLYFCNIASNHRLLSLQIGRKFFKIEGVPFLVKLQTAKTFAKIVLLKLSFFKILKFGNSYFQGTSLCGCFRNLFHDDVPSHRNHSRLTSIANQLHGFCMTETLP